MEGVRVSNPLSSTSEGGPLRWAALRRPGGVLRPALSPSRCIKPAPAPDDAPSVETHGAPQQQHEPATAGTTGTDRPLPARPARRRPSPLLPLACLTGTAALLAAALLSGTAAAQTLVLVVLGVVVALLATALHASRSARTAAQEVVADLAAALESARDASVVDEATGLLNRHGVVLVAGHLLESARRGGGAVHCCVVEVTPATVLGDGRSGEPAGTARLERLAALRAAAATALRSATRSADVLGCDESGRFLVVGPGTGLHAQELERRVRAGLAEQRHAERTAGAPATAAERQTVDVGAALLAPWDDGDVADLLARAEKALAQRRALRSSAPPSGWGRRRADVDRH